MNFFSLAQTNLLNKDKQKITSMSKANKAYFIKSKKRKQTNKQKFISAL